jgi:hypothetical protein
MAKTDPAKAKRQLDPTALRVADVARVVGEEPGTVLTHAGTRLTRSQIALADAPGHG